MKRKLRSITFVLFSICCAIGFSTNVNAAVYEMDGDMEASEVQKQLVDGVVIEGNGHTIKGSLAIPDGVSVTIQNVTLDGYQLGKDGIDLDILLDLRDTGDVVVDNVKFINYSAKGIYVEATKSLTVKNSYFDAYGTRNIDDNDYESNPDAELMYRSAAGIDINLGNPVNNVARVINVDHITITNNTFKNVIIDPSEEDTSTAGAIKIKIKNAEKLEKIGKITIEDNSFENNERDLVIGTNDPSEGTLATTTADLEILLVNNSAMNVGNFSTPDRNEEVLEGNYKLNYADSKKYELDDNLYYIVDEDNIDTLTDEEMATILEDQDVAGFAVNYQGVSFNIARETLLDEDLEALFADFDIVPTEETTIEALKEYQSEGVMFFTMTGMDLLDDGMSFDVSSLGEEFVGQLYLYYYDETNGLQLVSNPDNAILTFDKNGTYVLSATNLLDSTPSEEVPETPGEEVPEVPQTFDALGMYAGIGLISVAGIAGAVIYLKRRNA